jgi:hypothetical protein
MDIITIVISGIGIVAGFESLKIKAIFLTYKEQKKKLHQF